MTHSNKTLLFISAMTISISVSAFQQSTQNTINPRAGMVRQSEIQKINEQVSNKKQAMQMPEAPMPPAPQMEPTNSTIDGKQSANTSTSPSGVAAALPPPSTQIATQPQNIQPNTSFAMPTYQEKSFENNHSETHFQIKNNKKEQLFAQKYAMLNSKKESFKEDKKYSQSYTYGQPQNKNKNLAPYIERARRAGITDSKIQLELRRKNEPNFIAWVERVTTP